MEGILKMIGTTQTTAQFARDYLKYIAYGGPAIVISTAYTNIIRGEGASQNSMVGLIAGTAVNIVLDPIFILDSFLGIPGLGLGVKGAAIATVIATTTQTVGVIMIALAAKILALITVTTLVLEQRKANLIVNANLIVKESTKDLMPLVSV